NPAYNAARAAATGDLKTLVERRQRAIDSFLKMGATTERILAAIGKSSIEDIDLPALETLQGIRTALKDGDTTIEQVLPAPSSEVVKPSFAKGAPEPESPNQEAVKESAASDSAATPSQPSDPNPLLDQIRDAQKPYGITDAQVISFAKESKIVGRGHSVPLEDCGTSILEPIVKALPKLIEKLAEAK